MLPLCTCAITPAAVMSAQRERGDPLSDSHPSLLVRRQRRGKKPIRERRARPGEGSRPSIRPQWSMGCTRTARDEGGGGGLKPASGVTAQHAFNELNATSRIWRIDPVWDERWVRRGAVWNIEARTDDCQFERAGPQSPMRAAECGPAATSCRHAVQPRVYRPTRTPKRRMRGLRFEPSTRKVVAAGVALARDLRVAVDHVEEIRDELTGCRGRRSAEFHAQRRSRFHRSSNRIGVELLGQRGCASCLRGPARRCGSSGYGVPCLPNRLPATSMFQPS